MTSVSAGQDLCGAPRRNRTGDPILTMEPPGTAVRTAVSAARVRPSGPKLWVLFRRSYALILLHAWSLLRRAVLLPAIPAIGELGSAPVGNPPAVSGASARAAAARAIPQREQWPRPTSSDGRTAGSFTAGPVTSRPDHYLTNRSRKAYLQPFRIQRAGRLQRLHRWKVA
jgi:hypothetical protein